jgi:hypothetical protein
VSGLYLYALLDAATAALPAGLQGETLRVLPCAGVWAVAGGLQAAPAVSAAALRAHDTVVRALADGAGAALPARFGQWLPSEEALREALQPRAAELAAALRQVAGCVQMTVRVFGLAPLPAEPGGAETPAAGAGARYLAARRDRRRRLAAPPEIEPLRAALRPLVRAERVERRAGSSLAALHQLVARGDLAAWRRAFATTAPTLGTRLRAGGPFPPYAFTPEAVAS